MDCISETQCVECISTYQPVSYTCAEKCGDALVYDLDCDLEPGNDYDGCTDQCEVEDDFECLKNGVRSLCSYNGTFAVELVSTEKELFANSITMKFNIQPFLHAFNSADPNEFITFNDSAFQSVQSSFDTSTKQLLVTFTYSEDMEGKNFNLALMFTRSSSPYFFATQNQEFPLSLQVDQALPGLYYSEQ